MATGTSGFNLLDSIHPIEGLAPATPSGSTPDYINLKYAKSAGVLIHVVNGTTVTGSAITLLQCTVAAGTNEKALGFTTYYTNLDTAAADAPWTKATATNNTFTTLTTNSKNAFYYIPVDPATLDINNSFTFLRAGTANAVNTTLTVLYLVEPKNAGNPAGTPSFIS